MHHLERCGPFLKAQHLSFLSFLKCQSIRLTRCGPLYSATIHRAARSLMVWLSQRRLRSAGPQARSTAYKMAQSIIRSCGISRASQTRGLRSLISRPLCRRWVVISSIICARWISNTSAVLRLLRFNLLFLSSLTHFFTKIELSRRFD